MDLPSNVIASIGSFLDYQSRMNCIMADKTIFQSIHHFHLEVELIISDPHRLNKEHIANILKYRLTLKPMATTLLIYIHCDKFEQHATVFTDHNLGEGFYQCLQESNISLIFVIFENIDSHSGLHIIRDAIHSLKCILSLKCKVLLRFDLRSINTYINKVEIANEEWKQYDGIHMLTQPVNLHLLQDIEDKVDGLQLSIYNNVHTNCIDLAKYKNAFKIWIIIQTSTVQNAMNFCIRNWQLVDSICLILEHSKYDAQFVEHFKLWFNEENISKNNALQRLQLVYINYAYMSLYKYIVNTLVKSNKQTCVDLQLVEIGHDITTTCSLCRLYELSGAKTVTLFYGSKRQYHECLLFQRCYKNLYNSEDFKITMARTFSLVDCTFDDNCNVGELIIAD